MSFKEEQELGAGRVDPAWENAHADERRAAWEVERRALQQERRHKRANETLPKRLYAVMVEIARMPKMKASSIAASAPSAEDGAAMPPRVDEFALGYLRRDDVARHIAIIKRSVEALEDAIDSEKGFGAAKDVQTMIGAEKDRLIFEMAEQGLTPTQISELEPALGSTLVVERVLAGLPV